MRRARIAWLLVLSVAVVASILAAAASAQPARSSIRHALLSNRTVLATGIVAQINRVRAQHGLVQVTRSPELAAAAHQHSEEMAALGYFSHASHDGSPLQKRLQHFFSATNYRVWSVGETLLWSSPSIGAAAGVQAWLNSPEHRRVLLDPRWRQIGLSAVHDTSAPGVYGAQEVTVITADFGTRTR